MSTANTYFPIGWGSLARTCNGLTLSWVNTPTQDGCLPRPWTLIRYFLELYPQPVGKLPHAVGIHIHGLTKDLYAVGV